MAGIVLACSIAVPARAQWMPIPGEEEGPLPTASELLNNVREAFPKEPLVVHAILERRESDTDDPRSFRVRLQLQWDAKPPVAHIRISDAFGRFLAEGTIIYREDGAQFHFSGEPEVALENSIFDTDFTWGDLALSFLWWSGGEMRGFESRRGRRCFVVDLPNPDPSEHAASVRLWIDQHVHALLQAEIRSASGDPVRRLSVRSLRRIGRNWALEDLEMRTFPENTRTLFRVEDLYTLAPREESL